MPTVSQLTDFVRKHKSKNCPKHSSLRKAELLALAESLGYNQKEFTSIEQLFNRGIAPLMRKSIKLKKNQVDEINIINIEIEKLRRKGNIVPYLSRHPKSLKLFNRYYNRIKKFS